jgi:amidohydrolase
MAAFLATAEAIKKHQIEGRVRLLGTPAEEGGGGKIELLKAGAYEGVDACLMGHPGPRFPGQGMKDGVVVARCMARAGVDVTFHGVNAHAGNAPWLGRNALDAVVAAYTSIAMLRQQTIPNQRIHAIISKGGDKPNVIPHLTKMQLFVRSETDADTEKTCRRSVDACEGAAKAAGCSVEFKWYVTNTSSYFRFQVLRPFETNHILSGWRVTRISNVVTPLRISSLHTPKARAWTMFILCRP